MRALAERSRALIGSLQTTTLALAWLALLVFWGTLYQARVGLLAAEQRFFDAWVLWVGGVIPLPATRMVLALLAFNLLFSMVFRLPRQRKWIGVWLIHAGFVFLLVGGLWSGISRQEGRLWLAPGESTAVAVSEQGELWRLPLQLSLQSAEERLYPGTTRAQDYKSVVRLHAQGVEREAVISLNQPLRDGEYSVYQISFSREVSGRARVGFLVSRNPARWLPYLFSAMTGIGLFWHFFGMFGRWLRKEAGHA